MSPKVPYLRVALTAAGPKVSGTLVQRLGQGDLPESLRTAQDVFSEWRWDGSQVIVNSCRLGFFPLFYYATDSEFATAPSVEALVECGAPTDLDDAALATFLRLGWVLGEDTIFQAIRLVPPGGELRWNGGRPKVTGGYTFPRPQNLSRNAAIEGYGELFRQAVGRRASKNVRFGMPLSGGRDSRHILLELNALGCRPEECFTNHDFPPFREEDIRIAGLLTQRLGIPHRILGQPGSRLAAELRKNRTNSYGAMENIWAVNLYPTIARYTPTVYEGIAGDVISGGSYLHGEHISLFAQGRLEELSKQLVERWFWRSSEEALARVLTTEAARRFARELAVERVAMELAKHSTAPNPLTSFYFWNRTRRVAALQPFAIAYQAGVTACTPFLDHDVLDFLASLPAEMYLHKTFHTETIHRMHPEFSDVPFAAKTNLPYKESNWHYRRFVAEASAYLAINGRAELVKRGPTVGRLLSFAFLRGTNVRMRMNWISPFTVLHLSQIEKLCLRGQRGQY